MLKYLLDTNMVKYVLKRRPKEVLEIFNTHASRMAISSITLSELIYGAERRLQEKMMRLLAQLIANTPAMVNDRA